MRHSIISLSYALFLGFIYLLFFYFQDLYLVSSEQALKGLLRQDFLANDPYKISQTLTNLESLGFIRCSQLTNLETGKIYINLSTRQKNLCDYQTPFFLTGKTQTFKEQSLNGLDWAVTFTTINSRLYFFSFFCSILVGAIFITVFWFYQRRVHDLKVKKIEELKKLARHIAHDIKSPLMCLNFIVPKLNNIKEEEREVLKNTIKRIRGVLKDLDKIKENCHEEKILINLPSLVSDLIKEKKMMVEDKKIKPELINRLEEKDIHHIYGEKNQLERVFSNIINNAIESIDHLEGIIQIIIGIRDGSILITVKDNGRGIPSSIISKVGSYGFSFGKEKNQSSGSGIGLYHARDVIDRHRGTLEVKSDSKGTEVIIKLPF